MCVYIGSKLTAPSLAVAIYYIVIGRNISHTYETKLKS